jgi:hypothetical protein
MHQEQWITLASNLVMNLDTLVIYIWHKFITPLLERPSTDRKTVEFYFAQAHIEVLPCATASYIAVNVVGNATLNIELVK